MPFYFVSKNAGPGGYHDVHVDDGKCGHSPEFKNRQPIGFHLSGPQAVRYALKHFVKKADGCQSCVRGCHTRAAQMPKKRYG